MVIVILYIWLVVEPPTPLKNDGVKVNWDDEIPNLMGKSFKIPWFQSPPSRYIVIPIINHY